METTDGYLASNGECSPRKEGSRMQVDLSLHTHNGQHSQSPTSPSAHKIKQEEGTEEDAERRAVSQDEMTHSGEEGSVLEEPMIDSPNNLQDVGAGAEAPPDAAIRLPNGDRPFQCNQCGVSFTQKGNLLRHIKLHTGEKPFKCPFCSYACRRRDALTGHLRTHSVGKPHKCNYCGRSYKQRTSLEEHKERCHNYLQSAGMDSAPNPGPYAEVPKEPRPLGEVASIVPFERPPVIERLQANVAKRKSTTPQKFVGEKMMRYSYPDLNFDVGLKYEKEAEIMQAHMMDQALSGSLAYINSDTLRPIMSHPPLAMPEVVSMVNPLFHSVYPLGPRLERPNSRESLHVPHHPAHQSEFSARANGGIALARPKTSHAVRGEVHDGRDRSPSNSGQDSADSARSSPRDKLVNQTSASVRAALARPDESGHQPGVRDGIRVFGPGGNEVRVFQCDHCRVLFLDHVMYTIHMGCHGYRDPLECNICGHCCKDRYEFSSHIVRGVHTFR
ncbi:zinc finger protein Helios isoform X2 [Ictalurus furcatus]|uniref:zinc finger protein Helios isoform X2 n=1 Tax=Ictalurus furcatus TaxID=66913 RepID=UPI002350F6EB|nr:zinc finger protein Helios isoform X2 [Ictalurus furcatus]XP_053482198.1 zinc finger protein Helios isoform X2 [Ictalurus furcatus]